MLCFNYYVFDVGYAFVCVESDMCTSVYRHPAAKIKDFCIKKEKTENTLWLLLFGPPAYVALCA